MPRTQLYAVKVTMGQERNVASMLADKSIVEGIPIASVLSPIELKGYIIVESSAPHAVDELIRGASATNIS